MAFLSDHLWATELLGGMTGTILCILFRRHT